MNYSIAVKYGAVAGAIEPSFCRQVILTGVIGYPRNHTPNMSALTVESEKSRLDTRKVEAFRSKVSYGPYRHSFGLFHTDDADLAAEAPRLF